MAGNLAVGGGQVCRGHLQIEQRLPESLVLRVKERAGLLFAASAQALLLAGRRVLAVEDASPTEHRETGFIRMLRIVRNPEGLALASCGRVSAEYRRIVTG